MNKISILFEFLEFLKKEKKWWLIPIALFLALLAALVFLMEATPLSPFIYPFF